MELCDYNTEDLSKLIRERKATAVEVLDSCLKRIEQVDGRPGTLDAGEITEEDKRKVHAFISVTPEIARAQAQEVDRKLAAGEDPGILAGIPYTVKDVVVVKGTKTTMASRILANYVSPYTATVIDRLNAAGGVMLGKVNLDEFTFGSSCESTAFQPAPRNPWNTEKVTGGSSGGSVASMAAHQAWFSVGSDTAGSIRLPAAYTGTVGLKPTYGRVSRYGLIAAASSLDVTGFVARDVTASALALQASAGADAMDAATPTVPVADYQHALQEGVKGMRVGLSPDYMEITYPESEAGEYRNQAIPEDIRAAVLRAAELLARQGAEIVEDVPMPNTKYGITSYFVISRVEVASNLHRFDGVKYGYQTDKLVKDVHDLYRKSRGEGFGPQPILRVLMGMYVSAAQYSAQYYKKSLQVRAMIRHDFDEAFDPNGKYRLHALLTPTTPTTAFPIGELYGDTVLMQYSDQLTVTANHAGIPALSIPAGLDKSGMPVGVQLIGTDFAEANLFRVARAFEIASADEPWRSVQPAVLRDLAA